MAVIIPAIGYQTDGADGEHLNLRKSPRKECCKKEQKC